MSTSLASGLHQMPVVGDFIMRYLPVIIAVVVIAVVLIIIALVRSRRRSGSTPPDPVQPRVERVSPPASRPDNIQRGQQGSSPTQGSGGEYRGKHAK